jgi:DNA-damage-inducible protein D
LSVIEKAKEACENSKQAVPLHFVEFTDMVAIGLGVSREVKSFRLSRYACYLIAKTDSISLQFIEGAKIDFVEELGASYFEVVNPNSSANCGCGSSFVV